MNATVYFVRHGETTANRDGILQGVSGDYPLTDQGEEQAIKTGLALQHVNWDAIFTSDLPRAVNVCDSILSSFFV